MGKLHPLYIEAAKVVDGADKREASLKNLVYQSPFKHKASLLALALKVLNQKQNLEDALRKLNIINDSDRSEILLLSVLTAELVWGKKVLTDNTRLTNLLRENKDKLSELLQNQLTLEAPKAVCRYARVNTLQSSLEEVCSVLDNEGWTKVEYKNSISHAKYINKIKSLESGQYAIDLHVPNLLVFSSSTHLNRHQLYHDNKIFLQDKASCLSSMIFSPQPGEVILDACAAPGMKTTHMAAMMKNKGKIYCIERDSKRINTLKHMIKQSSATICDVKQEDFRKLNPYDYEDVTAILLDPSCTGDGISRQYSYTDEAKETDKLELEKRIEKLQFVQGLLLKHALSFPSVERVVYSTCSLRQEENEDVIADALIKFKNKFTVETVLENWPSRGYPSYAFSPNCVRTSFDDQCNGMFIACFRRKKQWFEKLGENKTKVEDNTKTKPGRFFVLEDKKSAKRKQGKKKNKRNELPKNNLTDNVSPDCVKEELEDHLSETSDVKQKKSKKKVKREKVDTEKTEEEKVDTNDIEEENYEAKTSNLDKTKPVTSFRSSIQAKKKLKHKRKKKSSQSSEIQDESKTTSVHTNKRKRKLVAEVDAKKRKKKRKCE